MVSNQKLIGKKSVNVDLTEQEVFDIINGLNQLIAISEEDKDLDEIEKKQYERYKSLLQQFEDIKVGIIRDKLPKRSNK